MIKTAAAKEDWVNTFCHFCPSYYHMMIFNNNMMIISSYRRKMIIMSSYKPHLPFEKFDNFAHVICLLLISKLFKCILKHFWYMLFYNWLHVQRCKICCPSYILCAIDFFNVYHHQSAAKTCQCAQKLHKYRPVTSANNCFIYLRRWTIRLIALSTFSKWLAKRLKKKHPVHALVTQQRQPFKWPSPILGFQPMHSMHICFVLIRIFLQ